MANSVGYMKTYSARKRSERRAVMDATIGAACAFCGYTKIGTGGLVAHRKDGLPHGKLDVISDQQFAIEMTGNKYVRLCLPCHRGVHWTMKFFGYSWDDIVRIHGDHAERLRHLAGSQV